MVRRGNFEVLGNRRRELISKTKKFTLLSHQLKCPSCERRIQVYDTDECGGKVWIPYRYFDFFLFKYYYKKNSNTLVL